MHLRLEIVFLTGFILGNTNAAPFEPVPLQRRNGSLIPPTISTTVRSSNGTDVSSSFRTLVYYQSDTALAASNLTDRQVLSVRRIDSCRSPGAEFLGSLCTHSQGTDVSLWRYTIHCRMPSIPMYNFEDPFSSSGSIPREPHLVAEHGSCQEHEICVNSMPHERDQLPIATCVDTNKFLPASRGGGGIDQNTQGQPSNTMQYLGDALREIGEKNSGITFSDQNGSSVIVLDSLEVDVGVQGSHDSKELRQQKCKDCYGMRTKTAPADADFMNIEATLAGTAALAGIIWVTVFAG